jgi:hypothetical protein
VRLKNNFIGENEMRRENIEFFVGKRVKLVQRNNFVLWGIINELYDDALRFTTSQQTSLIDLNVITEIVLQNSRGDAFDY